MSSKLKLGSVAVLFTTSVVSAGAAMAGDVSFIDNHEQARRLLAGPHDSSVERASVPTPRVAKAPSADAQDDARELLQARFVTQAVSAFEGAAGRIGAPDLDGHEQARRLLQR
jgi:SRSO17 transposase